MTHGFGFICSLVGAVLLLTEAAQKSDYHFWPCLIYSICISFLFLSSTLYHSFFMLPAASRVLQILDHVAIYLLIAGSYCPYLLIGLHSHTEAHVLACALWIVAFGGCVFASVADLNNPYVNAIEWLIFLVMGFALLMIYDTFQTLDPLTVKVCAHPYDIKSPSSFFLTPFFEPPTPSSPSIQTHTHTHTRAHARTHKSLLQILLGSGLIYSGGITFYVLGTYRPIYHVVWHLCVLIGKLLKSMVFIQPTGSIKIFSKIYSIVDCIHFDDMNICFSL